MSLLITRGIIVRVSDFEVTITDFFRCSDRLVALFSGIQMVPFFSKTD